MAIYLLIAMLFVLLVWFLMIYVRKSLWDTVHRNLLDLEDVYGGHVLRRSFLNRPYYHGQIEGVSVTINFSTEKNRERITYIDVSMMLKPRVNLTLSTKEWLQMHGSESQQAFQEIENQSGKKYLLKISDQGWLNKEEHQKVFHRVLDEMTNLAYLFVGKTGLICEWQSEDVANDTRFDALNHRIRILVELGDKLKA